MNTKKLFYSLFLIFALLPYIKLVGFNNTTSQPIGLLFAIFPFLFIRRTKLPAYFYYLGFVAVFSFLLIGLGQINMNPIRHWVNYFSLAVGTIASYKLLLYIDGEYFRLFKTIVYIWLAVAIAQYFIYPAFLSFLLSSTNGSLAFGRGVTSLATEPTYYGLIMINCLAIYMINKWYRRSKTLGVVILTQILFFSRSPAVILIILITCGTMFLFSIVKLKVGYITGIVFGLVFCVLFSTIFYNSIKETRAVSVLSELAEDPGIVMKRDYSVNTRIISIVLPFVSLKDKFLLPNGYGAYSKYYGDVLFDYRFPKLFVHGNILTAGRKGLFPAIPESLMGKTIFQLGGFGLGIFVFLIGSLKKILIRDTSILCGFLLFLISLIYAFSWTTMILPLIIGNLFYLRDKRKKRG